MKINKKRINGTTANSGFAQLLISCGNDAIVSYLRSSWWKAKLSPVATEAKPRNVIGDFSKISKKVFA